MPAGLAAGITEAVTVVTTMEVLKVRLQGQKSSDGKAGHVPRYRNAAHAACVIARDEGPQALFKGMSLTALRQATNVSGTILPPFSMMKAKLSNASLPVNLTTYTKLKKVLDDWQPNHDGHELPGLQTALCGLTAGAAGPISNAPIDTLSAFQPFKLNPPPPPPFFFPQIIPRHIIDRRVPKSETLVQRNPTPPGHSSLSHTVDIARTLFQQQGFKALYKGITPRIMRIAPGQAITYTIYEHLKTKLSG